MANLLNIIIEPGKVFQHIKEKDDWWIPFIVVVVFALIVTWVSAPAIHRLTVQKMAEMGVGRELPKGLGVIQYILIPIFTIIIWFSISFIFWMISNSLGSKWDYIKALDLFAYSTVVMVIKHIITLIVLLMRGLQNIVTFKDLRVATGLDLFFHPENPRLYALVSGIDIFEIWIYTLVAFGISEIAGISKKKSAIASIATFIVALGIKILTSRKGAF